MTGSEARTGKLASGLGAFERFAASAGADFRFAPLNALLLVGIFVLGLVVHQSIYGFDVMAVGLALGSALALAVLLRIAQVWGAVVVLGTADCLLIYLELRPQSAILLGTVLVALLVSCSLQIACGLTSGRRRCCCGSGGSER